MNVRMFSSYFTLLLLSLFFIAEGSHFRGGTISWTHVENNTVNFFYKLGWTYNNGPGCTPAILGQQTTGSSGYWNCISGCGRSFVSLSNTSYLCTGASEEDDYEQGENSFTHIFPDKGPFTITFTGCCWIALSDGRGGSGNWNISATVDIGIRSDTKKPNNSPQSVSKPVYIEQYNCEEILDIPVIDIDGDDFKCRWATGKECGGICDGVPGAVLDPLACKIRFTANHTVNGWFGAAIMIEDFPKSPVTLDDRIYTSKDPLSTVPLQFLIHTKALTGSCNDKPTIVSPTPTEGAVTVIHTGQTQTLKIYAHSARGIRAIDLIAPAGVIQSAVLPDDQGRSRVYYIKVTWAPTASQKGSHIICAQAEDVIGKSSDSRCLKLIAWDEDPCDSSPCSNGGSCARNGFTSSFTCLCNSRFTGSLCETVAECETNENPWNFPNPCNSNDTDQLEKKLVHPIDATKYLECDLLGNVYIIQCPHKMKFHPRCQQCSLINETCFDGHKTPLSGNENPCSVSHLVAGKYFFPYAHDATKFIHCDVWGKVWIMNCPVGEVWNDHIQTCHYPLNTDAPAVTSGISSGYVCCPACAPHTVPCTDANVASGKLLHPIRGDSHHFIQCDSSGRMYCPMPCNPTFGGGLDFFDPHVSSCVHYDPNKVIVG